MVLTLILAGQELGDKVHQVGLDLDMRERIGAALLRIQSENEEEVFISNDRQGKLCLLAWMQGPHLSLICP